jgi:DNA-directed RNA polymerase subunit beta
VPEPGVPESFKVLVKEMQSLRLDVKVLDEAKDEIELKDTAADETEITDLDVLIDGEEDSSAADADLYEGNIDESYDLDVDDLGSLPDLADLGSLVDFNDDDDL